MGGILPKFSCALRFFHAKTVSHFFHGYFCFFHGEKYCLWLQIWSNPQSLRQYVFLFNFADVFSIILLSNYAVRPTAWVIRLCLLRNSFCLCVFSLVFVCWACDWMAISLASLALLRFHPIRLPWLACGRCLWPSDRFWRSGCRIPVRHPSRDWALFHFYYWVQCQ